MAGGGINLNTEMYEEHKGSGWVQTLHNSFFFNTEGSKFLLKHNKFLSE